MKTIKVDTIKERISALRTLMEENRIRAYIIPGTDTHQNEYIPAVWKRREWISGFSGSNGDVVVTGNKAGLWTDSRYFLQADMELASTGIDLYKLGMTGTKEIPHWIHDELKPGESVGIDPALFSQERVENLERECRDKDIDLRFLTHNLVDLIWKDKPSLPCEKAEVLDVSLCGEPYQDKIARLREKMTEAGCGFHIITSLDAIAWLLNIRGTDIPYNPVLIAYVIVTQSEVKLFISPEKVTDPLRVHCTDNVGIYDYKAFMEHCVRHAKEEDKVWIDPDKTSYDIILGIKDVCMIYYSKSPITFFKAVKNRTEIECLKKAHIRDGAAMVRFIAWLDSALGTGTVTELSAEKKLEELRKENEHFRGLSFSTISAFGDHGAIVHYTSSPETDRPVTGQGLYLIDSGAQYRDGTTDITRTVAIGTPTAEQREMFTRVLKGHIALATTMFPRGTKGIQLDAFARKSLWDARSDYGHGTGHGVGHFLNVHETPPSISYSGKSLSDLLPGMVCSIEPGYYKQGEYGIRIENLVLVAEDKPPGNESNRDYPEHEGQAFYYFKIISLCPLDRRCIESSLLTEEEKAFINEYHNKVRETLTPLLDTKCATWLARATEAV